MVRFFLRRWVCSKEGQRRQKHLQRVDRKHKPRALTRIGCCAAFRVSYSQKKGMWIAKEFVPNHMHGVSSNKFPFLQDLCMSTQLYGFKKGERSRFYLGIDKSMNELATEDAVSVEFETLEKTEAFYFTYSNVVGFSDNVADGREASTSVVQPRTCDVVHGITLPPWTLTDEDNVPNGREGSTSGVQPITCDVVHQITLLPWTLTMPKIDKGTQLIKIPHVNDVEGLPLPEDVQHVNAETVTMLLQMVGGLHEVVMETILQARDKLKEATEKVQQKDCKYITG
ncbi:FHY3/FAR1 family [Trema orientale]|uniref:FHY3/FAR1 family n=1 Tax=Trema orientale TaxID=63057 RepID=A0A2P5BEF8_TREOI|nr:FHY3/FAR1 family [Trema orientale]